MTLRIKVLLIGVLISASLIFIFRYPFQGDSLEYFLLGANLVSGHGFSTSQAAPFIPSMNREPVYPLFLATIFRFFGTGFLPVQLIQVLIFALTVILTWLLSCELFLEEGIRKYAFFITVFSPTLISYPSFLFSEILATFLFILLIFSLTLLLKPRPFIWFFAVGLLFGVNVLCKAVLMFFCIPVIFILLFINKDMLKRRIFGILILILAGTLVMAPWMARNYRVFHKPAITLRGAKVLWMRSRKVEYQGRELAKNLVFGFSETLGKVIYPKDKTRLTSDIYLAESLISDEYMIKLQRGGLGPVEIDDLLFRESIARVISHPIKYILLTPLESIKMLSFCYLPAINQPYIIVRLGSSRLALRMAVLLIRVVMKILSFGIFLLAIAGAWINRRQWKRWVFLGAGIIYINLIHSLLFGDARYAVPLIPYYSIFAAAAIYALKEKKIVPR